MSERPEAPRLRAGARWAIGLFLAFFCLIAFAATALNTIRLSDDQLYLMTGGLKLQHPAAYAESVALVESRLADPGMGTEDRYRYQMRFDYTDNYLGASALYAAWFSWFAPREGTGDAGDIAGASFGSLLFTTAVAMLAFSALAASFLPLRMAMAFVLASGVGIGLSLLLPEHPTFIVFGKDGLWDNVQRLGAYLLDPSGASQFTVFGFTPRSQMFLFTALIFLLRWSGRSTLGWWLVPVCALIHQSHTTLLLLLLLLLEFINGPRQVLRPARFLPIALALVMTLSRESLLDSFKVSDALVFGGLFAVLLVAVLVWAKAETWLFRRHAALGLTVERLRTSRASLLDAGSLAILWCATLPAGYLACRASDDIAGKYLWCQLHARSYAMLALPLQIALCLGLFAAVGRWGSMRAARSASVGLALVAAAAVSVRAWQEVGDFRSLADMRETAFALEGQAGTRRIDRLSTADETLVYYLMVDDLRRQRARLSSVLQAGTAGVPAGAAAP